MLLGQQRWRLQLELRRRVRKASFFDGAEWVNERLIVKQNSVSEASNEYEYCLVPQWLINDRQRDE
jgi:hypothetical protein